MTRLILWPKDWPNRYRIY